MTPDELLVGIADTLRSDIAPAVDDEYARTQAFMAAVVLQRVAREVALGPGHAETSAADASALHRELGRQLADAPADVVAALDELAERGAISATGPLVESLYRWGIDRADAAEALATVRRYLRRDIDRLMEIAR